MNSVKRTAIMSRDDRMCLDVRFINISLYKKAINYDLRVSLRSLQMHTIIGLVMSRRSKVSKKAAMQVKE